MRKSNPECETTDYRETDNLGIESYGISVTTLEEVFLRVAGGDFDQAELLEEKVDPNLCDSIDLKVCQPNASKTFFPSKLCGNYFGVIWLMVTLIGSACSLIWAAVSSVIRLVTMQCCCCSILSTSTFWKHSKALIIKRAKSAQRDQKTIVFQLLIPALFLFLGLLFLKLKPHPDQQPVFFTTSYFNPLLSGGGGGGPIPFDLTFPIEKEVCLLFTDPPLLFLIILIKVLHLQCFVCAGCQPCPWRMDPKVSGDNIQVS